MVKKIKKEQRGSSKKGTVTSRKGLSEGILTNPLNQ